MSDLSLNILYLDRDQVIALGGEDMDLAVRDMENLLMLREQGDVRVPDKVSMNFGKTIAEEKTFGRINAMPGYVGGDYQMAGIKWVGSNPGNLKAGLPRASAVTILNDPVTKFPLCIMDGTVISNTRTGAVGGAAVKYLAKKNAKTLMIYGAGLIAEYMLSAAEVGRPALEAYYVYDLVAERAEAFAEKMSAKLGKPVTAVRDGKAAGKSADIVVTATGAASPVLDFEDLGPGALYINFGGYECTYDTVSKAGKRFVDNWQAVRHRNTSAIAKMVNEGVLSETAVDGELGAVIAGTNPGRTSDDETIYFNCVGMGIEDVAIATRVYREALRTHTGTELKYW
ncbi:MAG: hypothetical protein IKY02_04570 [Lachnospiraceae bacterium]|nr:hypothetical protein [Lachnospiraceae bacterium]